MRISSLTLFAAIFSLQVSQLEAADYKVDSARSELVVQVFKDGVASAVAHDHVIKAGKFSGTISYDEATGAGNISMDVDARSLKADDPALRKKYKLTTELSEGDRQTVENNMKAENQLNVARYPNMTFKSVTVTRQSGGTFQVAGDLTIRGKTQRISFPATVEVKEGTFTGKGQVKLKQTSFGYEPYSALFGAIRNKDEIILNVTIVGTPAT
jgi:polyisoprenoid-binding protein YceI